MPYPFAERRLLPTLRAGVAGALCFFASDCGGAGTPLCVQLDWIANVQFAGVLVAKDKGWYEQAGLDVTVRPIDLGAMDANVGEVVAGKNTIGIADGLVLLRARADRRPVRAFATMLQASPLCILALKGGPVHSFRDLKGKRIGLHSYDHLQLDVMLAHNHMTEKDVNTMDLGDDLTSLISGRIDAQVAYSIDEKVAVELKGYPTVSFPGYENGFVAYSQVYYATEAFQDSEPGVLATFLIVTNRGWKEAFAHPREAADMVVKKYLGKGDVEYQERSLKELERFATLESDRLGSMRMSTWEQSCRAFGLPPEVARGLANFSILSRIEN